MPELPPGMPPPTEAHLPQAQPVEHEPAWAGADDENMEPGFDADIAAIFSEEATELLEQAESSLGSWTRDRADRVRITELKRVLHTLKGGARMAGIRAMGDLSHEMESFLGSLEAGAVASDSAAIEVLQASLDELHRMRETAMAGQHIVPARDLIERVRAVAAASAAGAAPAEPVEAQPIETPAPAAVEAVAEAAPSTRGRGAGATSVSEPVAEASEPVAPVEPPYVETEFEEPVAAIARRAADAGTEAPSWPQETFEAAAAATPFVLPGREPVAPAERHELARVSAELLDELLNSAGEVSIFRARVEQQMTSTEFNLAELGRTVTRLREQLRKLELETEAQILFRHQGEAAGARGLRPAGARPLFDDPAAVAGARRVGQRRREHREPAREREPRGPEPAAAAGPRRGGTAERADAHAHGAVPASRPAPDAPHAAGGAGGGQESRTRDRGRRRRDRPAGPRAHAAALRAHAAQCRRARHRASRGSPGARQGRDRPDRRAPAARGRRGRDHRRGRRRGSRHRGDPRQGAAHGAAEARAGTHRRGVAATRPRARILHRRPAHAAGGPRHRHGRRRDRGQAARRRALHRVHAGAGRALHDPAAVHARHHAGARGARARRVLRAAGRDGRGRFAPAVVGGSHAPRGGASDLRVRRPRLPLPAPRRIPRQRCRRPCRRPRRRCR